MRIAQAAISLQMRHRCGRARGDGRCVGGFLSLRSWALVAVMVVAGRLLRGSHVARGILGAIYLAVGIALFLSSRVAWRAWRS